MINSIHNPQIQWIHELQARSSRRREAGAFVVEGVRLVEEALLSGWEAECVLCSPDVSPRGRQLVDEYTKRGCKIIEVDARVMKFASQTETPQGLLAVLKQQKLPLRTELDFALLLDNLRDPGNLGTILRTAAAAGVQGVILPPGMVDVWSPKVVRAAMGAHFRLPIHTLSWDEFRKTTDHQGKKLTVYLAEMETGMPYTQVDFRHPTAILVGGEAEGIGAQARQLVDETIHIPMPGRVESLNAAVAAGIILFEVVRQRAKE